MNSRDYDTVASRVRAAIGFGGGRHGAAKTTVKPVDSASDVHFEPVRLWDGTLGIVVDALWEGLRETGVSWVGFYCVCPGAPDDRALTLGPSRDSPACSPIGLHGVCGQAFTGGATRIIRDVAEMGDRYVACDPRDRSEIVLPCSGGCGGESGCWGVLDLDSHEVGAFDESDERGLILVLGAAGIRCGR